MTGPCEIEVLWEQVHRWQALWERASKANVAVTKQNSRLRSVLETCKLALIDANSEMSAYAAYRPLSIKAAERVAEMCRRSYKEIQAMLLEGTLGRDKATPEEIYRALRDSWFAFERQMMLDLQLLDGDTSRAVGRIVQDIVDAGPSHSDWPDTGAALFIRNDPDLWHELADSRKQ